jgi:hypothetical protein
MQVFSQFTHRQFFRAVKCLAQTRQDETRWQAALHGIDLSGKDGGGKSASREPAPVVRESSIADMRRKLAMGEGV